MISILKTNYLTSTSTVKNPMMSGCYVDPLADEINELRAVSRGLTVLSTNFIWSLPTDDLCGTDEMINMEKYYLQDTSKDNHDYTPPPIIYSSKQVSTQFINQHISYITVNNYK